MSNVKKWEDSDQWIEIAMDLCTGVGECVNVCPVSVYEVDEGKVRADNVGECIGCRACENVCPNDAIIKHWSW